MADSSVQQEIYVAFEQMKQKNFSGAETTLRQALEKNPEVSHPVQAGLLLSTMGVLYKLKDEPKEAWRCYEKAEKLMPDDPSLKLIMAKFLIDKFAQYDAAIKKLEKVLKLAKGSPSFEHQAHATIGLAYLKKGNKKDAIRMLEKAMETDFVGIVSAQNINFDLLEAFLARNLERDRCQVYIQKALRLAESRKEHKQAAFLTKLLDSFEITVQ